MSCLVLMMNTCQNVYMELHCECALINNLCAAAMITLQYNPLLAKAFLKAVKIYTVHIYNPNYTLHTATGQATPTSNNTPLRDKQQTA